MSSTNRFENIFKKKILAGDTLLGGWLMSASATVTEAMAYAGYDYLVIDNEHGPATTQDAITLLRAIEQTQTLPVVRMADHNPTAIKQMLDIGAMTLYFPFVESREEATSIVNAALYPPAGKRGFAKIHRASRYGSRADYCDAANQEVFLIAQLETPEAMEKAVDIGSVEGIDAVFIGPGDLSAALGVPGQINHALVKEKITDCVAACRSANIVVGTVMPTPADAAWAVDIGIRFVSIANDIANLMNTCKSQISQFRELQRDTL